MEVCVDSWVRRKFDRENAAIGVYLTLEPPTKPMLTEAAEKGFYHSPGWNKDYPRLQILTVEDLLSGKTVNPPKALVAMPPPFVAHKNGGIAAFIYLLGFRKSIAFPQIDGHSPMDQSIFAASFTRLFCIATSFRRGKDRTNNSRAV